MVLLCSARLQYSDVTVGPTWWAEYGMDMKLIIYTVTLAYYDVRGILHITTDYNQCWLHMPA